MRFDNITGHIYTLLSPRLWGAKIARSAIINKPIKIDNPHAIYIGDRTYLGQLSWLMGGEDGITLKISDDVQIGHFAHIVANNSVHIERKVLIADKVFISDSTHIYENVMVPIMDQGVKTMARVVIGENSWIGENVCILGASVGKHCVIGANSVVTRDIPDYCVAVGNPARVIKMYDFELMQWKNVHEKR